ncbi:N-acetylglucosamine-6-phosphate deacetylase [Hyalangium versicolor]|uniref:N-acetylglucosamine-6-phosphate deacetylase n=1 Tax=Hyalangium versicolor TaxID=2861190 RepID=UPI001CCF42BE|nr:N-acetylglucosamine-6-phosphate deacetylase [Hyalangium versicolor]
MKRVLMGARLFTGERILEGHGLVLEGERIVGVVPTSNVPTDAQTVRLPEGALLAPGFIDAQVNGAGGVLFNETPTPEGALAIAAALRRTGTTGLLPTFITDEQSQMRRACDAVVELMARPASGILGLHLEGPFLSSERPGVHEPRFIRAPESHDIEYLTALSKRIVSKGGRLLMTVAPERVDDASIGRLAAAGVVVSAGHTAATFERTNEAVAAGVRGFTHLFNAMPPVQNRQPGPVVAAFSSDEAWCSIIADGVHVHPALMRLLLKVKPTGKVILVTDAMPPVGSDDTSFMLYGRKILRGNGKLVTENGTLAGSDLDMVTAVRNCIRLLGLSVEESLRMASLYPATYLGLEAQLGRLAPGYRADLTLLTPELSVLATWVAGQEQWY